MEEQPSNNNVTLVAEAVTEAELVEQGQAVTRDNEIPMITADTPEVHAVAEDLAGSLSQDEEHVVVPQANLQAVPAAEESSNSPVARAEFISATVIKRTSHQIIGIGIRDVPLANDIAVDVYALVISSIDPQGLLEGGPLRVGDHILSINGKSSSTMDKNVAVAYLSQLEQGTLTTIVVRNPAPDARPNRVETMVEKMSDDSAVGLGVASRGGQRKLYVSKVLADGLFAHSLLNIGDHVLSVNGVDVNSPGNSFSPNEVIEMIKASSKVTIVTDSPHSTGMVLTHSHGYSVPVVPEMLRSTHACICIWMLIISLFIIGIAIRFY